ncbi:MAG: DUF1007 family protein [Campylobacterota bacterium]|nr:DUF1007 family protein [Campylobacterota bacterium]
MRIFIFFIFIHSLLFAHPHTFIDVFPTVKLSGDDGAKINFKWKMDEMASSMLIMDFDKNADATLDKDEVSFVYTSYFKPLDEYSYFTLFKVNGVEKPLKIENFNATIENNQLVYSFDIDIKNHNSKIELMFFDKEMFVAMILEKEYVNSDTKYVLSDMDEDFYYGYKLEIN